MINKHLSIFLVKAVFLSSFSIGKCDQPCSARDVGIEGRSIVCVCNAAYCDTITRDEPAWNTYVAYTSTRDGKRFEKSTGPIRFLTNAKARNYGRSEKTQTRFANEASYRINSNTRYQKVEGFGGSVTDAASINWRKLSDSTQRHFINSYFGKEGIEYNMIRVPIGGADFSTHPYTYNESPWNDKTLSNYSLSAEDYFYKSVDVQQINDKFPEKKGGLKELYEKGPRNAFFLVKFWADLNTNNLDDPGAFYGVTSVYESNENMTITCSTKVCSFGKQVVEKVETEYARFEGGRFVYRIQRSPMCEYMVNFIHKLKHLPEKYMMNSVLENFTILQVVSNRDTQETLLCAAFVFEVSNSEHGAQHHIYRLVKD
ncbi:unnamed protein product [Euphydryas editha]|uniref:YAP binding domain-containing protein n=1 Tax=Euphydryas editha TaxID=104508 RepID=A0AAU9TZU0_EUPED|nr:unnamed protein product [Euphydryas editha]